MDPHTGIQMKKNAKTQPTDCCAKHPNTVGIYCNLDIYKISNLKSALKRTNKVFNRIYP